MPDFAGYALLFTLSASCSQVVAGRTRELGCKFGVHGAVMASRACLNAFVAITASRTHEAVFQSLGPCVRSIRPSWAWHWGLVSSSKGKLPLGLISGKLSCNVGGVLSAFNAEVMLITNFHFAVGRGRS